MSFSDNVQTSVRKIPAELVTAKIDLTDYELAFLFQANPALERRGNGLPERLELFAKLAVFVLEFLLLPTRQVEARPVLDLVSPFELDASGEDRVVLVIFLDRIEHQRPLRVRMRAVL